MGGLREMQLTRQIGRDGPRGQTARKANYGLQALIAAWPFEGS
jgi:hypothetical protein